MKIPLTLAALGAGLLWAGSVSAQEHASGHPQPTSGSAATTTEAQATTTPTTAPDHSTSDHSTSDHSSMDHSSMDHSSMDHSAMDHSSMDHSSMDHSSMDHSSMDHSSMDHSSMDHSSMDHSSMDHSSMDHSSMDHSSMDHSAMGHPAKSAGSADQPRTPIPVPTDADRAAAVPPPHDHPVHDNPVQSFVLLDRLETVDADGGRGLEWEAQAWIGTDRNKLWLRSEGERIDGNVEDADLEVLYGRSVSRWWDVVAGVRHHFEPGEPQDYAVLGVTGMAPYKFEVNASLYVGGSGYTGARVEVEYEALLTSRLILQPALEANLHSRREPSHDNGAGLGTVEAGLRLRYEITRQFAPYIGVVRERAFGETADLRRAQGQDVDDTRVVAGLRIWF